MYNTNLIGISAYVLPQRSNIMARMIYFVLTATLLVFASWIGYWTYVWYSDPYPLSVAEFLAGLSVLLALAACALSCEKLIEAQRAHRLQLIARRSRLSSRSWNDSDSSHVD